MPCKGLGSASPPVPAAGLAKSPNPDARRAATWLQQMAAESDDSGH